jgi:AcrR family transcriptional regulator
MVQTTQRLPAERRRATVMAAASELFAERGYDHASLDQLAARVGVTKPIVYRHFASKKDLYLQLLAAHRDELLATLAKEMATRGALADRVPRVADAWFSHVESHPFAWAMLFADVTGDADISSFHTQMRDTAREAIVGLLMAEHALRIEAAMLEPLAEVLRSAMTGLALWWLDHRDVPRAKLVATITQTAWSGLASAIDHAA